MDFYDTHIEESKSLILARAEKVLMNEGDLENKMFAKIQQKVENLILSDYLIELANERIENFKISITTQDIIDKYKEDLRLFLVQTLKQRL